MNKCFKCFKCFSLNANKCHIFRVGTRNQKYEYKMSGVKIKRVQGVKDLGVTIASNLKFSQHCKDAAGKVNRMLGFTNSFLISRIRI